MPDEFFLGGCSKAWRNDGEHIRTQFLGFSGHADRIAGTDTAGSGVNRYTAIHSINCYADDLGLLVLIEDVTLAIGAQNKNTVNSGINQPFDLINKFFTVNCSVLTHWCYNWNDNAFYFFHSTLPLQNRAVECLSVCRCDSAWVVHQQPLYIHASLYQQRQIGFCHTVRLQ